MDFNEAERRFRTLDSRYRAAEISPEAYQAALYQLQVTDEMGRLWMMQASTGQWYVLEAGRWQAGSPPREHAVAGRAPLPPQLPVGASTGRPATPRWLVAGGVLLALAACAGVILAGVLLWPQLSAALPGLRDPSPVVAPAPDEAGEPQDAGDAQVVSPVMELVVREMLPVAADGSSVSDGTGVALQVPQGALLKDGQAQLAVYEPQGGLFDALQETYVFETGFYAATAQGSDDGVGRATLRLPAAGPDSRIVTAIDGQDLVMLDVKPEGGVLTLNPRLGASEGGGEEMVATLARGGTIRHAVVHPRQNARQEKGGPGQAALVMQGDPRNCAVDAAGLKSGSALINGCRKNEVGSVFVSYPAMEGIPKATIDRVVDAVESMMSTYGDLQFTAAKLSSSAPLHVKIFKGGGSPYYKPANGVIYIPMDVARTITAAGSSDLYHEMAHWVQDEAYVMTWAFLWDDKTWWLETAAENMVMLADPGYTAKNLTTYGTISLDDSRLDLQAAPYDWRGDSYVQAQLVKLNMCDDASVCPLSEATFKKAINEGIYPFEEDAARQKLSANLDDYARYLLGATPQRANPAILGDPAVRTGEGYGETVQVARSQRYGDFWHLRSGNEPQMTKDNSGVMEATVINAALDKDGVYPLRVVSGYGASGGAGLPAALRIAPGAPFYYRAGDGEVTFHDGKEELVLQPIHADMGLPSVRVVAMGRQGGERFRARVELIDLSGVWVLSGVPISNDITCSEEIADEGVRMGLDAESTAAFGVGIVALGSPFGDYAPDAAGTRLTWGTREGRAPEELAGASQVYEGSVLIKTDAVQLEVESTFDLIGEEQGRPVEPARARGTGGPSPLLVLGGLAPLAVVSRRARAKGQRGMLRLIVAMVVIGAATLLMAGCFGIDIYGTGTGKMAFKELAFVGGEDTATLTVGTEALVGGGVEPGTEPLWVLRGGEGTFQVDLTTVAVTHNEEGDELRSTRRCSGPVVYDMEAAIFKDVVLRLEE